MNSCVNLTTLLSLSLSLSLSFCFTEVLIAVHFSAEWHTPETWAVIVWTFVLPIYHPDAKFKFWFWHIHGGCWSKLSKFVWKSLNRVHVHSHMRVCHLRCSQLNLKIQSITFKISLTTIRWPLNSCLLSFTSFIRWSWICYTWLIIQFIDNYDDKKENYSGRSTEISNLKILRRLKKIPGKCKI